MVSLDQMQKVEGARSNRIRRGRGIGSGYHKTAGRGHKGQKARSGGRVPVWFEGGQMPLQRRLPKRGFCNPFRTEYAVVNVERLNEYVDGDTVDIASLRARGMVGSGEELVKVLGGGDLDRRLTVRVHGFSAAAREKITAAGGQAEEISLA
ncbi:MAG: 50S ribosomal protein L15 [Deltaproteobacteria bacterium]|nr:50S ribosomal protein L15 [Candidatus Anaeroferrophillacea bacterium]